MAIAKAEKFFKENVQRYATAKGDPLNFNLNAGLLALVEELHREVQQLHAEIAYVSQQVAALRK